MPIDAAKLNELPGRFVTDTGGTAHVTEANSSHPSPTGTWTIDPADSTVSFAWPKLRLWTMTGRLHGLGVQDRVIAYLAQRVCSLLGNQGLELQGRAFAPTRDRALDVGEAAVYVEQTT